MSKYKLYLNAFSNIVHARMENEADRHLLKQNIFYLVKLINSKPKPSNYEEAHSDFQLHSILKQFIEQLTPVEFIELFPIKKEYDGHKNGVKDYFYTKSYINNELDKNKLIPDALFFLSEYWNDDINDLNVEMIMNLSYLRQLQGKPSLAEEWADMNGIETHTKHTDHKGNEFLLNKEGKTKKVMKRKASHLKLVH